MAARCCSTTSAAVSEPERTPAAICDRADTSGVQADDRRNPEAAVALPSGAAARTSSRSSPATITSSRNTFSSGYGCVIGVDVVELQRVDVGEVLEHAVELCCRALDLVGREVEPGQPGDLGDGLC